jgi:UDP-N-acetylglucosamine:LPS N-acetylglucosamine transferase
MSNSALVETSATTTTAITATAAVAEDQAAAGVLSGARKLLFAGSAGGHLAQLLSLRPWWETRERVWVTFELPDAKSLLSDERVIWAHYPTTRNIPNLLRNVKLAMQVLRRERPDVVVSTGAGVAYPFFLAARALKIRTVYVEVYDRIDSKTMTGSLCRPLSDLFLVQWEAQTKCYPGATVVGTLL